MDHLDGATVADIVMDYDDGTVDDALLRRHRMINEIEIGLPAEGCDELLGCLERDVEILQCTQDLFRVFSGDLDPVVSRFLDVAVDGLSESQGIVREIYVSMTSPEERLMDVRVQEYIEDIYEMLCIDLG